jgi:hypothetical protein
MSNSREKNIKNTQSTISNVLIPLGLCPEVVYSKNKSFPFKNLENQIGVSLYNYSLT